MDVGLWPSKKKKRRRRNIDTLITLICLECKSTSVCYQGSSRGQRVGVSERDREVGGN